MTPAELGRFRNLTFEDFKKMATDPILLPHEKIGFPSFFRHGHDLAILNDMATKITALQREGATIIDIGCGCGELTQLLVARCATRSQALILVDSERSFVAG